MSGKITKFFAFCAVLLAWASCDRGRTPSNIEATDTLTLEDTLETDSAYYFEEEDDGLSLENHATEVFSDFIFAFTHNGRFQAERIRFPLRVKESDGVEYTIRSGRQFREEFQLPDNEYYTLILGDKDQMDTFQNDSTLTEVKFQCIDLANHNMVSYDFSRTDGRWYLDSRTHAPIEPKFSDFLRFYDHFTTDSVFQQESIADQLVMLMEDPDTEEGENIEGTIDSGQWPVFRPDMPCGRFVNIDFGQTFPNPNRIYLFQCGVSNGLLNIFTFQHDNERWRLTAYEN